jgi:hypothetical protein
MPAGSVMCSGAVIALELGIADAGPIDCECAIAAASVGSFLQPRNTKGMVARMANTVLMIEVLWVLVVRKG